MRNFRAPLNLNACKVMRRKHLCRVLFLIKLQAGALQLYLNETLAQVFSCKFCLVSQNTYLQNICESLFLLFFIKFYFFLCEKLQNNEDQRFSNDGNVNQFKKNTVNFYVIWGGLYLHETTSPSLLFSKI